MRSRNIKPGFWDNEDLAACSALARLCFIGLWMLADREGRLEDRPKRIRVRLFPFEEVDVDRLLRELEEASFIVRYQVDGVAFLQIVNFVKHQDPHYREKASEIPPPKTRTRANVDSRSDQGSGNLQSMSEQGSAIIDQSSVNHVATCPSEPGFLNPESGFLNPDSGTLNPEPVFPPVPSGPTGIVDDAGASTTGNGVARCPTDELVSLWHECCAPPLPAVGVLSPTRRKAVSARWREVCSAEHFDRARGVDWFRWLFAERIATSPFLMGRVNGRGEPFRATWDWVMRPTNFAKVVDGNYANRNGNGGHA